MENAAPHSAMNVLPGSGGRLYRCVCGTDVTVNGSEAVTHCPQCQRPVLAAGFTAASMSIGATLIGQVGDSLSDLLPVHAGEHLDHFCLTDLLGAGGMGAVFRARDESLQRFVAIKVIRGGSENAIVRERIIQEARAQARVSHKHVVHIYYVGIHHQCPFFAMELVCGHTLAEHIRNTRLPFSDVVRFGLETADALRHSAALGIIHGDVKPSNILLDEHLSVKLSDFGLAGLSSESDNGRSTTGPAGTLNYMAPEVAGGRTPDVRSDMYSLGVMLYELTFGELPHGASSDSLEASLKQRQVADVRLPAVIPSDRPERWGQFLSRLLNRDPLQRFDTWDDVYSELSQWQCTLSPPAGRISRALAWLLDMSLVILGVSLTTMGSIKISLGYDGDGDSGASHMLVPLLLLWLVPLFLTWRHLRWGTSVGKKLLHLQITDIFGLKPSRRKVLLKSIGTLLPIWVAATDELLDFLWALGSSERPLPTTIEWFFVGVAICTAVWLGLNALWLLFSKRRQTLNDRLLNLYVTVAVNEPTSELKKGTQRQTMTTV